MQIAAIVEGYGDVASVPTLLARTGQLFGDYWFAPNPIKAGEWPKLRGNGQLERYLDLAASREYDVILVLLDLDDGCAVDEYALAMQRVASWKDGRDIKVVVVFIAREFEALLLASADSWFESYDPDSGVIERAHLFRDAKGEIKRLTKKRYKETQDQLVITRQMDLRLLATRSRPFRKLCKDLFDISYEELSALLSA